MSTRWVIGMVVTAAGAAGVVAAMITVEHPAPRPIVLTGAVLVSDTDPRKETPIAGVTVTAADDLAIAAAISNFSGLFRLEFRPTVAAGDSVTLEFRHPQYKPLDVQVPAGRELYIARLEPLHPATTPSSSRPPVVVSDIAVRYSVQDQTATNVGSAVKAFEVVNTGGVPCAGHPPCSPDRKWRAAVGGVSLDAGAGNEFRNARLSCIAGPCPFTHVDVDRFSAGGQRIAATVRDWSDTTTFVLEAEVFRPQIVNTIQYAYPFVLGSRLNFTLPPRAEGPSFEAELDGEQIVFPLVPSGVLSWTTCEVRVQKDRSRAYRCELNPGYVAKGNR